MSLKRIWISDDPVPPMSAGLKAFIKLAFDSGIRSASIDCTAPFVLTQEGDDESTKGLEHFLGPIEESMSKARKQAGEVGSLVTYCALGYFIVFERNGAKSEALAIEVMERSQQKAYIFYQLYQSRKWYRRFEVISKPSFISETVALF